MKEIGPTAGIDCKNTMTKINCVEVTDCQSTTKNKHEREYHHTF